MKYNKLFIIVILNFIIYPSVLLGQEELNDAIVLKKFSNYTTWPAKCINKEVDVSIVSDSLAPEKIIDEISNFLINNRKIKIQHYNKVHFVEETDILLVLTQDKQKLIEIQQFIKNRPILSLSKHKSSLDYGIMFYYYFDDKTLKYLYNKQTILDSGIFLKSSLLREEYRYK